MGFNNSTNFKKVLKVPSKPNGLGSRHTQALLMFLGVVFGYFQRVNISAAIVPMTQPTINAPYYTWEPSTKSLILSSFFWGYVLAQVPAGLLSKRFGAKIVLGLATAGGAVLAFFHPLAAADGGWIAICVLRVLTGVAQGSVYPCIHTLLSKWVPCNERSFLSTIVYSGAQFGTTVILALSGVIIDSAIGWPGLFYISGTFSLVWALIFLWFGANEPNEVKYIDKAELEYIQNRTSSGEDGQSLTVPWNAIFTSLPFYGLLAAHCGFTWGFYTLLTEMPTYMSNVLQLDVKSNALLSALPYFAMWVLCFLVSPISDLVINRGIVGISTSRKLFNTIGQWFPMICLLALGYMRVDEKNFAIMLLTLAVSLNACCFCGYLVNHMDLSPNFAGPLMSLTNGIAGIMSIIAPLVVGSIVSVENDASQWRIVFFITAGVYFICNLFFIIFGKATVQPWNQPPTLASITTLQNNS